jgi:hypothetical protein
MNFVFNIFYYIKVSMILFPFWGKANRGLFQPQKYVGTINSEPG